MRKRDRPGAGREATPPGPERRLLPTGRLEAFSDGVFAIVVTLLVLELRVPEPGAAMVEDLLASWPAYLGYVVSFAFIGGAWIGHSTMTRFLKAADQQLLQLNLLLLLFVSLLPFSTSLMASHLGDADDQVAVVLFGLNLTLAALLLNVLVTYAASRPELAADDVAEHELRSFRRERRGALVLQAAATALGLLVPLAAVLVYLVISLLILVEPLWRAHRRRRASVAGLA